MANETSGAGNGDREALRPVPSGTEHYGSHEIELAKNDLVCRALQYAKDCGATIQWPPPGELDGILQSDFWFFVCNAGVHRQAIDAPVQRIEENKKKLMDLMKAILPLLELLRNDTHCRALTALHFENWLTQRHSPPHTIDGAAVAERTRQCLELLAGAIDQSLDRLKTTKTASHKDRGRLIRWALEAMENSGGWWPANPTDEDLTALSVLTGVCLENFDDDFDERQQLAEDVEDGAGSTTHLQGLWRKERKRCADLRLKLLEHSR